MRTVLVANRKGGVGKTMIAVNLAAALAAQDQRVAIADADRQQSSSAWLHRRPMDVSQIRGLDWSKGSDIGDHPKRLDWLIIDAPGALKGAKAEKLIAEARAVLTPVQPSVFDENSTRAFLSEIEDLKRVQKGKVAVHVIANRVRPRSRAGTMLEEEMAAMGYPPLATLSDRSIYGEYAAYGLSIFDRNLASIRNLKAQWLPIFSELGV